MVTSDSPYLLLALQFVPGNGIIMWCNCKFTVLRKQKEIAQEQLAEMMEIFRHGDIIIGLNKGIPVPMRD